MKRPSPLFLLSLLAVALCACFSDSIISYARPVVSKDYANGKKRAAEVATRVTPSLKRDLESMGLRFGSPVFVRSFKEERQLELWVQEPGKRTFKLFRTYPILAASGKLGPKYAEGDRQVPEGFYFVKKNQLNPASRFHLAYNIGYPNAYDRVHSRTGSFIMVHGSNVSIGCLAMSDEKIEEIYTLCAAALNNGQLFFRHHSFPFRMTDRRMQAARQHPQYPFWQNLKQGYDLFEQTKIPPNVEVLDKTYVFTRR